VHQRSDVFDSSDQVSAPIKRLGVFGGAFDPPHNAHVALVQAACTQLELDCLLVFPTGHAWHKHRELTSAVHRLAMAQLAFEGVACAQVDARELRRAGPTFTIDTLRELSGQFPQAELFLMLGADQAAALSSWHQAQQLIQIATICIAARAGTDCGSGLFDAAPLGLPRSVQLELPATSISATQVRRLRRDGFGVDHLVPKAVAGYIAAHNLYQIA
jgi:nicotinate-nucleotide adenylyltransferase